MKKYRIDVLRYENVYWEVMQMIGLNYDVTWTINAHAIIEINRRPRHLHQPPK